jgi:hypothetical protein
MPPIAGKEMNYCESSQGHPAGASEARVDFVGVMPGLKSRPTARASFSAAIFQLLAAPFGKLRAGFEVVPLLQSVARLNFRSLQSLKFPRRSKCDCLATSPQPGTFADGRSVLAQNPMML